MANETVTYDLATVLTKMEARLDRIETTQNTILLNQTKLEGKIDTLETKQEGKIDALETKLERKIDALETKLEGKIDALETKLEGKIDALETKLEGKIDALEVEVTTIKEDMKTVKGTQGQQIWALIGVLATGVIGALIINGWRFWFPA